MAFEENAKNVEETGLNHKLLLKEDLDFHQFELGNMKNDTEFIAKELFEIASEQRLNILFHLLEKKYTVSNMAKELEATVPEVYRNFERLVKAGFIEKDVDGKYFLTTSGQTVCVQIPSLIFTSKFEKYFKNHTYGNIPTKFIQRIGSLDSGQHIVGVVKVLEQWKEVYKNAENYIYNILSEVPYTKDVIEELVAKMEKDVKVKSIFSETAIIPKERKEIFEKINFKKFIDKEIIQRRMMKKVDAVVILNEKEACLMLPSSKGDIDISEMIFSKDPEFHEWCLDFFKDCWEKSSLFQERKLK